MTRERKRRGAGSNWLAWLGLLILALLVLRALGPGGLRPRELLGLEPGPAPAPTSAEPLPEGPPEGRPPPPSSASPRSAPGGLRGRIAAADGQAAAGVTVEAMFTLEGQDLPVVRREGPTGPDGAFRFPDPPPAWTGLRLRAFRGPLSVDADLGDAADAGALDLDLRLPDAFTVGGVLLSAEEGRPLPGMQVALGERSARSDPLGRFAFRDLPASLLEMDLPPLEVTGAGRRPLTRPLAADGPLDDLLLRLEAE